MDGNGETTISNMKILESSNSNNHLQTNVSASRNLQKLKFTNIQWDFLQWIIPIQVPLENMFLGMFWRVFGGICSPWNIHG